MKALKNHADAATPEVMLVSLNRPDLAAYSSLLLSH